MFEWANPGFLAAGGALVSSPIIIHLINRLRYKRVRWAAMEFLLKSQQKNRRKLIIEQLILLFLRCLLVVLVTLLVARAFKLFGWQLGQASSKKTIHLVLLDDSLSMKDWVPPEGQPRNKTVPTPDCFDLAKYVIHDEIAEKAGQSSTPQDMVLVVLSQAVLEGPKYRPRTFEDLASKNTQDALQKELKTLKCTSLHLPLKTGLNRIKALADQLRDDQVQLVVHVLSDYRQNKWTGADKDQVQPLIEIAKNQGKVNLIDCAYPFRQKGNPQRHDNVGISKLYPDSRVVASGTWVRFKLDINNFSSRKKKAIVNFWDDETGRMLGAVETDLLPNQVTTARFDTQLNRASDGFLPVTAQLTLAPEKGRAGGQPEEDGLLDDNIRHTSVFVRAQVPILIVDGDPKRGQQDGGDTRHVAEALESAPGAGFKIEAGGTELLDQPGLERYPTIFLLNVPSLNETEERNLDNYVANGGGVAFFLGKDVDPQYYNKNLYRDGKGLFPVPLADQYTPPRDKKPLQPNLDDNRPKVFIRSDRFRDKTQMPIFGALYESQSSEAGDSPMVDTFNYLPIYRFWEVKDLTNWKPRPGQVDELATLPNLNRVGVYGTAAANIRDALDKLADNPKLGETANQKAQFQAAFHYFSRQINHALERDKRGQEKDCTELADALGHLLHDHGEMDYTTRKPYTGPKTDRADLSDFWDKPENMPLAKEIAELLKAVQYGNPLVITNHYHRGRVVTCMTTAGRDWNGWAALPSFVPVILETQTYLTSVDPEAEMIIGSPLTIPMGKLYAKKVRRNFYLSWFEKTKDRRAVPGKKGEAAQPQDLGQDKKAEVLQAEDFAKEDRKGDLTYVVTNTLRPGFYRIDLTLQGKGDGKPHVEQLGYVFNVDTPREGDLQRVTEEVMKDNLRGAPKDSIVMQKPYGWAESLKDRRSDFSETAWFYLVFLLILVAEQAMAVHLSFHLHDGQATLPTQALRSQTMAGERVMV